jgi:hypothetical protein
MLKIAVIAHDGKKADMVAFIMKRLNFFKNNQIIATGTKAIPFTLHLSLPRLASLAVVLLLVGVDCCSYSAFNHSIRTSVDMFADEGTDKAVLEAARRRAAEEDADAEGPEDLLAQAADDVRKAKMIEAGLKAMEGQAGGKVHGRDIALDGSRKKDISEYRVPLRGRYAGRTMAEVDDDYIEWALKSRHIAGWQKGYFAREKARRRSLGGHPGRDRSVVQAG